MTTMKLNWGAKIAILYGGFVILIVTLVTMSMKQDFQLVSGNYYEQEIKYQEVIDAGKNQALLSAPVTFTTSEQDVTVALPAEFADKAVKGKVSFYAAASAAWDATFDLSLRHNALTVPRSRLHRTHYKVSVSWEADGKKYYQETNLNLYQP